MVNITHKSNTLRIAIAEAMICVSSETTIDMIINNLVPKGNVFSMAKTAGLFGVKRTSDMIPDCHPLPIEFSDIRYKIDGLNIIIEVEVHTIYKTGVEVEAMHGASVVALTIYDMLKPIDKNIEIKNIKLKEKKGGKSDFSDSFKIELKATVIVCSDSISTGKKEDKAGLAIIEKLKKYNISIVDYQIIPDDSNQIIKMLNKYLPLSNMIIFTGGTGLSPKDITPETLKPLIERPIPGIEETIRNYGQQRMPYSMLSRSVAGMIGKSLILALPGSTKGASESMDSIFPSILHIFKIQEFEGH